jgi:trigger factor
MQVSVENIGNLGRRMTVSVPLATLETQVASRLREIAGTVQIKGFRKGKVPAKVIEQRYGAQVRSEALGDVARYSLNQALSEQKLSPAANPTIEKAGPVDGGLLEFVASFEVVPDFGTIDVKGLKIQRPTASVGDTDIDQMIETLRAQRRTWTLVERAAKAGDLVKVETSAVAGDARVPAEGVESGATVLGSNVMFAELEAKLDGMSAGQEATHAITFPDTWRVAALAGQTAQVTIKVTSVSEPTLPALDEAFVKSFGIASGDIETFRKEVRSNLERELKGNVMSRLRAEVVDKLVAAWEGTEFPPKLIEAEAAGLARQAEAQARQRGQQGAKFEAESFLPSAKRRVMAGLLVNEIARQNELRLDPKRVEETLSLIASTYEEPAQVVDLYRKDPQLMGQLQARVMEEQVIDWVASHADATELPLSFTEAMRQG